MTLTAIEFLKTKESLVTMDNQRIHPAMLKALVATMEEKVWWNSMCAIPASQGTGFTVRTLNKAIAEGFIKEGKRPDTRGSENLVELTMKGIKALQAACMWRLPNTYKEFLLRAQTEEFFLIRTTMFYSPLYPSG